MPVPNTMADLPTLAGSNSPQGTETVFPNLDDYIRSLSAIIRSTNAVSSSTIASASTTDVSTSSGEHVNVTGTTTITSLGTGFAGCVRELKFSGILTLTHSANLILPGAVSATTAANDVYRFRCLAAGQWICTGFSNAAAGSALASYVTLGTAQTISGAKSFSTAILFGSTVAPGGVTDLSRHIDLFGGLYGLCVTGGRTNLVAAGAAHGFTATAIISAGTVNDVDGDVRIMRTVTANATTPFNSTHLNKVIEKSNTTAYTYGVTTGLGSQGDAITVVNSGTAGNITLNRGVGVELYRNGVDANISVTPGSMVTIYRTATTDRWVC